MITYEEFKELYNAIPGEPECSIYFDHEPFGEYMIIKYDNGPTFQKCFGDGYEGQEIKFESLDALYHTTMPDGICLEADWERIVFLSTTQGIFVLSDPYDYECAKRYYLEGVPYKEL